VKVTVPESTALVVYVATLEFPQPFTVADCPFIKTVTEVNGSLPVKLNVITSPDLAFADMLLLETIFAAVIKGLRSNCVK
jgi:hypothetical protein